MECAQSASGSGWNTLAKLLTVFVLAYASYITISSLSLKHLLESVLLVNIPFKSIAVFGGIMYILWIRIARDLCGSGYGVATALLTTSLCLATSPWFGVVNPWWFSALAIASFLSASILVERNLGVISNTCFCVINWVGAWLCGVASISPLGFVIGMGLATVSGLVGDLVGKTVARVLLRVEFVKSLYQ